MPRATDFRIRSESAQCRSRARWGDTECDVANGLDEAHRPLFLPTGLRAGAAEGALLGRRARAYALLRASSER
jgi:hypothetical protein